VSPLTDEQLLDRLGAALAPTPVGPTPAEVEAIRALALERRPGTVMALPPARAPRPPRRHPLVAAAAAVIIGLVVLGGIITLVVDGSGSDRHPPIAASGSPIDSAALIRARLAVSELRAALAGPDDTRVARARDELVARLRVLEPADRDDVDAEARVLLEQAVARLRRDGVEIPAPTGANPVPEGGEPAPGPGGGPTVATVAGAPSGGGTAGEPEHPGATEPEDTPGAEATEPRDR
jgi:hypothetical protein